MILERKDDRGLVGVGDEGKREWSGGSYLIDE